jgi:hypothetical protein
MAPDGEDDSRARSGRLFTRQVWLGYASHTLWRGLYLRGNFAEFHF